MIYKNKLIKEGASVSSEELGHEPEELTPNETGFEGMSIKDYLGFDPDLGLARSEELAEDDTYGNFFRNPKVMAAFTEHMDLTDRITRLSVMHMNEAEQNSVLTSLTSKLYDNIIARVDDIDYGEIPETKGDITKLSNYGKLRECINLMNDILKEFKQDPGPIREIDDAIINVISFKDAFARAFRYDVELPIMIYNNTVLSIINGVSYMIATCIEFIKTPNQDSFKITLDKVAYAKTKSNMIYNNLKKFNTACKNGDMEKAMEHVIQHRVKKLSEGAVGIAVAGVVTVVGIMLTIIPILREMVFFFYYSRMRVSDFLNIQADLLQMNAHNLENSNVKTDSERKRIVSKQLKIVELFRKAANKIAFSNKEAEVKTSKEIEASSKKMKMSDLSDELPDSVSALF